MMATVLLIEDNAAEARLVQERLDDHFGETFTLHAEPTLASGLRWLDEQLADVILLDLSLPDSQGLATYHRVRDRAPRTPVVVLSGHQDDAMAIDAVRAGAADYLPKQHADGVVLARTLRHSVERHRVKAALADSETHYRGIVETAEEGIVLLDAGDAVRFANGRFARMVDGPIDGLLGRPFAEFVAPPYREVARLMLDAARLESRRRSAELRLLRPDGEPLWVLAAVGTIRVPGADEAGAVVMLTDIDRRVALEHELVSTARRLERRAAERGAAIATARRELDLVYRSLVDRVRPPLQEMALLDQAIPDRASLSPLVTAARTADARIGALLELPALNNTRELRTDPVDVSAIANGVVEQLRAAEPDRTVEVFVKPEMIDSADPALVRRLLECLIGNAWRGTATAKAASLRLVRARPATTGPWEYAVVHNGNGGATTTTTTTTTTTPPPPPPPQPAPGVDDADSLALEVAWRIAERHGGWLRPERRPGQAAEVRFTLSAPTEAPPRTER